MRYGDEKYVEKLEEENAELRRQLNARAKAPVSRMGGNNLTTIAGQSSAIAEEERMRRARIEVAAEAGAGYGRVSLEALYLLPSEFTNAYQRLFLRALKESPGRSGEANPPVKKKMKRGTTKQAREWDSEMQAHTGEVVEVELALDRDPDRGGGKARAGGRRHRDHWIVKDESAFRLKKTVDDQLRELAEVVAQKLARPSDPRAAGNGGRLDQSIATQCDRCSRFLRGVWGWCPFCGQARSA